METRTDSLPRLPSSSEILAAIAVALIAFAVLLRNDPGGLNFDPDSYMRLARFRDGYPIFHGGFSPRDNAPYGTVVPWTMPMDGALAFFYAIGRAFADPSGALYFAARVASPFFCIGTGLLLFFGLRPFFSLRARMVIGGLAATAPGLLVFSLPGQADHHAMIVWLSTLFAIALIRHLFRDPPHYWDAAVAGIAAATALWTSPEEFIVIGTGLSALVLHRCMVDRGSARTARAHDLMLGGALSITLAAAWLVDRPYDGLWAPDVERLSIVYVSFAWLYSAALIGLDLYLWRRTTFSPSRNLVAAALLGGTAFLCWVVMYPDILGGPFGRLDQPIWRILIDENIEMQPMWRPAEWTTPHAACLVLIGISFAALIAKSRGPQRRGWIAGAILMIPITLLGIRFVRSIYFTEVLGSIPLGLVLARLTGRYSKRFMQFGTAAMSSIVMLAAYDAAVLLWRGVGTPQQNQSPSANVCRGDNKSLSDAIAPIANTDAIVMTEIDYAPRVLYLSSKLRTVAGGYMRNRDGIMDEFAFFEAHDEGDARAILAKRGVDFVLTCDSGQRDRLAFKDRIIHDTPAWLEPVGSGGSALGFRLYRVRPASE